jgi:hypothetical protein
MTPAEHLIEAISRELGRDWIPQCIWTQWRSEAEGIIKAIDAAGWQIVPKVPTEEMLEELGDSSLTCDLIYNRMLAAAPRIVDSKKVVP